MDSNERLAQDLGDVVTVLRDLVEPPLDVDEGLGVGDVVHDDDPVGVSVVAVHKGRSSEPRAGERLEQTARGCLLCQDVQEQIQGRAHTHTHTPLRSNKKITIWNQQMPNVLIIVLCFFKPHFYTQ